MRNWNINSWLWLGVLIGLLDVVPVHAFYNTQQGRWLSRDPVEEQSFFTFYTQGRSRIERQQLWRATFKASYLFSKNQPLSVIDFMGLRPCTLTIQASHLISGENGAYENFNSTDWEAMPSGDGYGYVSCGANTLNDAIAVRNSCASIPNMPRNNYTGPLTPSEKAGMDKYNIPYNDLTENTPESIDLAWEAAKQSAQARCRCSSKCGSCTSVRIVVTCGEGADQDDLPLSQGGERQHGTPKCKKSTTLDCKTGNFSMLK